MLQLTNQERIKKESDCYLYCIDNAFDLVEKKEFEKAAVYYENAARSLRELGKLTNWKESKVTFLFETNKSDKDAGNRL